MNRVFKCRRLPARTVRNLLAIETFPKQRQQRLYRSSLHPHKSEDRISQESVTAGLSTTPSTAYMSAPKMDDQPLPKLSAQEYKQYNRMAEHMDMFHENFRRTWTLLLTACQTGKRPHGMSIRQFLGVADDFCHHLTIHHTIEEQHIFPVLARKMDFFKVGSRAITDHAGIHRGVDRLESYVRECKIGERELRLEELGEVLESFGKVLWGHLDEEVENLGAENMRKYWSLDEMRHMPM